MQQMGIIPWTQWLPTPSFFIPFSDTSPIPAPPPIASFTASELLKWAGALAVNAAPLATLCFAQNVWGLIRATVWLSIRTSLPQPYNPTKRSTQRPSEGPQTLEATETVETPRPATPAPQSAPDDEPRSARDISRDEVTFRALEGQPASDPVSLGTVRRQSTYSTRGDEYVSDEEDTEVVSATLISFDVEASEPTDVPPGVWSAELRPSVAEPPPPGGGPEPTYRDNTLTRLPAALATDVLSALPVRIITAPSEAVVWRYFVRSYLGRRGAGVGDIYEPNFFSSLSWTAVANFLGMELIHLFLEGEIWATMTIIAQQCCMTEEEWNEQYEEEGDGPNDSTQ